MSMQVYGSATNGQMNHAVTLLLWLPAGTRILLVRLPRNSLVYSGKHVKAFTSLRQLLHLMIVSVLHWNRQIVHISSQTPETILLLVVLEMSLGRLIDSYTVLTLLI